MIDSLSIVMPCEEDRVPLLTYTLGTYMKFGFPIDVEFIIVSRTIKELKIPGLNIKLINYKWEGDSFNPSMALNIGVRNSQYENVMITCPEVYPVTNVIKQLSTHIRGNYVCQVFDQLSNGARGISLVNEKFRSKTPAMYFMAVFKKEDIEAINGWDEEFMGGYAFEDDDFGNRFVMKELSFKIKECIIGEHQFHGRGSCESPEWSRNKALLNSGRPVYAKRGLKQ